MKETLKKDFFGGRRRRYIYPKERFHDLPSLSYFVRLITQKGMIAELITQKRDICGVDLINISE
jgi:hypothetical protein